MNPLNPTAPSSCPSPGVSTSREPFTGTCACRCGRSNSLPPSPSTAARAQRAGPRLRLLRPMGRSGVHRQRRGRTARRCAATGSCARGDVEEYDGREVQPQDNGYLSGKHAEYASKAEKQPAHANSPASPANAAARSAPPAGIRHPTLVRARRASSRPRWSSSPSARTCAARQIAESCDGRHRPQRPEQAARRLRAASDNPTYIARHSSSASPSASPPRSPRSSSAPKSPPAAPSSRPTSITPNPSR